MSCCEHRNLVASEINLAAFGLGSRGTNGVHLSPAPFFLFLDGFREVVNHFASQT